MRRVLRANYKNPAALSRSADEENEQPRRSVPRFPRLFRSWLFTFPAELDDVDCSGGGDSQSLTMR